ncbi:transcription factor bHLH144 isoform X2 [Elaeis guineensis]|nr:transcription factor bHLH144 isoform X2 [Elaeis guineensis]
MQRDSRFFSGRSFPPDAYEVGDYTHNTPLGGHYAYDAPAAPAFGATLAGTKHGFASPLNGFEVQPSETCPKNFIIFDQTDNKNRIMFHPALAQKFNSPNFNICDAHAEVGGRSTGKNDNHDKYSSSLKENTEDIDALLSSEEEEEDDDVVSTGRTPGSWEGSSLDSSCSMSGLKSNIASTQKSASSGASNHERKRERMRKMVKALRGIIPGGDQLDTPAVLDEAVKYLKSLKVEMKQLGMQNFDDYK